MIVVGLVKKGGKGEKEARRGLSRSSGDGGGGGGIWVDRGKV